MSARRDPCRQRGQGPFLPVSMLAPGRVKRGPVRVSRMGRRRAFVLLMLHVALFAHLLQWQLQGRTISPLEPSEAMFTAARGAINAGLILLLVSLLSSLVLGRFFCGWGCHLVALQDLCGWLLKKVGLRPRPLRSRLLVLVPLLAGLYMFLGPVVLRLLHHWRGEAVVPWEAHLELTRVSFWQTFPGPWGAGLAFLVCGFVAVYLLGSKGFCTYACPYGGLFGAVDRLAPGRIRVTSACKGCAHCTAVCTSNVLVHKEVHEFGAVMDPGCMKCLDCVSVCPEKALYFGFGKPALFTRPRVRHRKPRPHSLGWRGEAGLAGVFSLTLLILSGLPRGLVPGLEIETLYAQTPLLLALGLSAITAWMTAESWRLVRSRELIFQHHVLKEAGRCTWRGRLFLCLVGLWVGFLLHSATVQGLSWRGQAAFEAAVTRDLDAAIWSQDKNVLKHLPPPRMAALDGARERIQRARSLGLLTNTRLELDLAWIALARLDLQGAESHLRLAWSHDPRLALLPWQLYRVLGLEGRRKEAMAALDQAIRLAPQKDLYRFVRARNLLNKGSREEASQELRHVVAMEGSQADPARMLLAGISMEAGRTQEAIKLLEVVTQHRPAQRTAWGLLQRALEVAGRTKEARAVQQRLAGNRR